MTKKEEIAVAAEQAAPVAVPVTAPLVQVEASDMVIPFIKVIQSLAEEVTPGKDKYNADVRPGDIYDSVTRTIFKDARVIICGLQKYFAEWTPEVRGTLVGKHLPDSDIVKNALKVKHTGANGKDYFTLQTAAGNDLIETYGLLLYVRDGATGIDIPAMMTLAKTSFMVGKTLQTTLAIQQRHGVPVFRMGTTNTSNTKGSWFKPNFIPDGFEKDMEIIKACQSLSAHAKEILLRSTGESEAETEAETAEDDLV